MIRIFQSKFVTIGLILLVGWLFVSAYQVKQDKKISAEQVDNVRAKMNSLEKENGYIQQFISYLKNPEFLAKEARLKLNYKSADEQVAYVYPEEKKLSAENPTEEQINFLVKMKNWFLSRRFGRLLDFSRTSR